MAFPSHPDPQQTERSTLDLPIFPTVSDVRTWDHNKLLRWIQQTDPDLLQDDDLEKFQNAKISGSAFLGMTPEYYKDYKISIKAGAGLKFLADEVRESKLLGQTAGIKRKVDETNAPTSQKRPRQGQQSRKDENDSADDVLSSSPEGIDIDQFRDEDDDGLDFDAEQRAKLVSVYGREILDVAKKARDVKRRNKQLLEDLGKNTPDRWKTVVSTLSNPAEITELVFPFTGTAIPERFEVKESCWDFMGREKFKSVVTELEMLRKGRSKTALWLYGSSGYGKSHILAALVCYLTARGEKVLYLPDCRKFSKLGIVHYMKHALLFTWTHKKAQEKIFSLSTEEEIRTFLQIDPPLYAIDQMNGLAPTDDKDDDMQHAKSWLGKTIGESKVIYSTSPNYKYYHQLQTKQNYDRTYYLYDGFSQNEMEEWWKRQNSITVTEEEKKKIESYTGKIPLFLKDCLRDGKISFNRPELRKAADKIHYFALDLHKKTDTKDGNIDWELYRDYVVACITGSEVQIMEGNYKLVDHRYFYDADDVGHFTCGLAVYAVTDTINSLETNPFIAHRVLKSMQDFKDNPSVAGFIIELAVLETIARCGLNITDHNNVKQKMKLVYFGKQPRFDKEGTQPVLYVPRQYNYRDIDGIIVDVNQKEKKLYLYPIQITISKSHKDSYKRFKENYGEWTTALKGYEPKVTFVWVMPEKTTPAVEETDPNFGKCVVHLSDIDKDVWTAYADFKGLDREPIITNPRQPRKCGTCGVAGHYSNKCPQNQKQTHGEETSESRKTPESEKTPEGRETGD